MPSLQLTTTPGRQPWVALQVSTPSPNTPLEQAALSGACAQLPVAGSQKSVVRATPSLQFSPPWDTYAQGGSQSSAPSQLSPLEQAASFRAWAQRSAASSQLSVVQAMPSSHAGPELAQP